jgi:hypothetical protein
MTLSELFDAEEQLIQFYQEDKTFAGLIDGKYGSNLLQTYKARILSTCMNELLELAFDFLRNIELSNGLAGNNDGDTIIENVENFAIGMSAGFLDEARPDCDPEYGFEFDVLK